MKINSFSKEHEVQQNAAEKVQQHLSKSKDTPTLLLLSGGSAFGLLEHIDAEVFHKELVVAVLDERFSTDPEISNFAQLAETQFYAQAKSAGAHLIDTRLVPDESLDHLAGRLNHAVQTVLSAHNDLTVIATAGMGEDGHIAGMMPYPEDKEFFDEHFLTTDKCFVAYDAGSKNEFPKRVTATAAFLKEHIDHTIAYVSGEEKKTALSRVVENKEEIHELPAQILQDMPDVELFTTMTIE